MRLRPALLIAVVLASLGLTITALGNQNRAGGSSASTPASTPAPAAEPIVASAPSTAERRYPRVPAGDQAAAELLVSVESALRNPATPTDALPDLGHQQQVIYRVLSKDRPRSQGCGGSAGALAKHRRRQLAARREFLRMSRGRGPSSLPAWRIIQPEPAEQLILLPQAAATGIEWEVLAAVNLVETGMGRIDGISVANARGPMKLLPTTRRNPASEPGTSAIPMMRSRQPPVTW